MALAPEREIFLRTGGTVRFLRISTRVQLAVATLALLVLGGWGLATGVMLWSQAHMSAERATLAQQQAAIVAGQARVDADKGSVNGMADDIEARQKAEEEIMRVNFGDAPTLKLAPAKSDPKTAKPSPRSGKVGDASDADRFRQLRDRQIDFEHRLAAAAQQRLAKVEQAIRSFGLDPDTLGTARGGMGGPYVPVRGLIASDSELHSLAMLLSRLNAMETTLATIPSDRPTAAPMETSSYGYRRDPFKRPDRLPCRHRFPRHLWPADRRGCCRKGELRRPAPGLRQCR